jgi:uncharacterized integral membrane protein (TIGR00698 family)
MQSEFSTTERDQQTSSEDAVRQAHALRPHSWLTEDYAAIVVALVLLVICSLSVATAIEGEQLTYHNRLRDWLGLPASWLASPFDAFLGTATKTGAWQRVVGAGVILWGVFTLGSAAIGRSVARVGRAFPAVFALSVLAYWLSENEVIKAYSLEYALWAIVLGLLISNTVGTPAWMRPAVMTEFYIKTGLVIFGAEVLFNKLLALSTRGIMVSWLVTPIVLIITFWFGQRILRIASPSLNMVISADMSVCGVSAAIATAAACKAKKEELSLAIAISLMFTVMMMIVMPPVVRVMGLNEDVAGAWMGGTIDSTGAVAAAGSALGQRAMEVATTIKMIQNILIGVVSFAVAAYWVSYVERDTDSTRVERPRLTEIWKRFPKFVLGFVLVSIVFSAINVGANGSSLVNAIVKEGSKSFRAWCFCLAFVSIGLDTNFRQLAGQVRGGKPLVLYVAGQSLNLGLTLLMAWLVFG